MRITPNQNLYLLDVSPAQRFRVDEILAANGIESGADLRGLRRLSMACPALPTCGLAVTEAERALPGVLDTLQVTFDSVGVSDAVPTVRMTGCPNGCARPYVAEIGLVGDAVDRYQVWLGGDAAGTRLARHVADRVHKDQLPGLLEPLLVRYRDERLDGEAFGDFLDRVQPDIVVPEAPPRPIRHVPAAGTAAATEAVGTAEAVA
jgi:sulfite reductase (ferredoxin)